MRKFLNNSETHSVLKLLNFIAYEPVPIIIPNLGGCCGLLLLSDEQEPTKQEAAFSVHSPEAFVEAKGFAVVLCALFAPKIRNVRRPC